MARSAGRRSRERWLLLVAALGIAGAAHAGMDTAARVDRGEHFVPQPEQARFSALGFDSLISDAYWLQAIQIVGTEVRDIGDKSTLVARLIDLVTTLDPWVGHPYRFAAVWLTESIEAVQASNRLLERGIAYHPDEWRNRHYLGFNHFYYLGDDTTAAEILEPAVSMHKAPRYLGALVAKLRMKAGSLDTAATFLTGLAASTEDEYKRAEYLKALDEIETERRARFIDRARAEYQRRHGGDLLRVEDLLLGEVPVLRALPAAHPHFPGFAWTLEPETGVIVSSFYKARYEPRVHRLDRERRERWRTQLEAARADADAESQEAGG